MVYLIDLILASAMTNMWIIRSLNKTRQDIYYRNINKFLVTQLAKTLVVACQINECRRLHHLSPHNDFVALFLLQRLPYHFVWSRHAFLLWWEQKLQITCFAGVDSFAAVAWGWSSSSNRLQMYFADFSNRDFGISWRNVNILVLRGRVLRGRCFQAIPLNFVALYAFPSLHLIVA